MAEARHLGVAALLSTQPSVALQVVLAIVAVVGFLLAVAGRAPGWALAALGVLLSPVRGALFGQFSRVVNPAHELAGGLWIGTLLMVIVAGVAPALRAPLASDRRGAISARLVNGFSPLALGSASALAVLGVVTAWRHLKKLDALWSTPYGYALIAKLCLVAGVVALGAWNWRRQKPRLGSEAGAIALRRSASAELALAGAVLVVTAILVRSAHTQVAAGAQGRRNSDQPSAAF
jgi:putative copper export protein